MVGPRGDLVGELLGFLDGALLVGASVGVFVGELVGGCVGDFVGGSPKHLHMIGDPVGAGVGFLEGSNVGSLVGTRVGGGGAGLAVGDFVCSMHTPLTHAQFPPTLWQVFLVVALLHCADV